MSRSLRPSCVLALFAIAALASACSHGVSTGAPPFVPQAFRATAAAPHKAGHIAIVGTGKNAALDKLIAGFMQSYKVPNAELAVSIKGKIVFSHAYTYEGLAHSPTLRSTIMRLASNTKAWTDAAIYQLIKSKKVNPNAPVFKYLGITKPLPAGSKVDPRVYRITIQDMIAHKSGWDDAESPYYDPTFNMRQIAKKLGLKSAVGPKQYVQAQLAQPLQQSPGTYYAYCNFCYTVLGMVIEKASGMRYGDYIAEKVALPMNVHNVLESPTIGKRLPDEVANYYSPYSGMSAIYVTSSKKYPYPYSGDDMILEIAGGAAQLATNAESMLAYMDHYIIWGVGTPPPAGDDWAREGSMPGTNTWAEQLPNGTHFATLVNTRSYIYTTGSNPSVFESLQGEIRQILDPGASAERRSTVGGDAVLDFPER